MAAPARQFTVVVPTRGRPVALGRCVRSLAALDYPHEAYDVVVVGDGWHDGPAQADDNVSIVTQPHSGPAAARNRGAREASHEFLAFVDDDCVVEASWLTALAAALDADPDAMIAGRVVNGLPDNLFAATTEVLVEYAAAAAFPEHRFATSNNFALARDGFLAVGGFDPRFPRAAGEDRDLSQRWLASGRSIVPAPAAVVRHEHDLSLGDFVEQHFNYGRGAFELRRGRSIQTPRGFHLRLLATPFRDGNDDPLSRKAATAALLAVSQAATAAGFALEAARGRRGPRLSSRR